MSKTSTFDSSNPVLVQKSSVRKEWVFFWGVIVGLVFMYGQFVLWSWQQLPQAKKKCEEQLHGEFTSHYIFRYGFVTQCNIYRSAHDTR